MFNIQKEFQVIHRSTPSYSSIMQYKHLLLHIFCFLKAIFYKFMWLLNNVLSNNELQRELVDLQHFQKVFDDSSSNSFRHFFYVLSETATWFVMEFKDLYLLTFLHHHIKLMHNNNKLCKYDNLYHLSFSIVHHKCV